MATNPALNRWRPPRFPDPELDNAMKTIYDIVYAQTGNGPQGPQGVPGAAGPQGPQGASGGGSSDFAMDFLVMGG